MEFMDIHRYPRMFDPSDTLGTGQFFFEINLGEKMEVEDSFRKNQGGEDFTKKFQDFIFQKSQGQKVSMSSLVCSLAQENKYIKWFEAGFK